MSEIHLAKMNNDFEIRKIILETLLEYEKNEVFSHLIFVSLTEV